MKFTGFHPQGEEERVPPLDLAALLVRKPDAAIFARMVGTAMEAAGIRAGDLLVIESNDRYADGQIVLAFVNGQAVVRQLSCEVLLPADEGFPVIELDESCVIRGRVVAAITFLKAPRFALPDAA